MSQYKCPYCFSDRVKIVSSERTREVMVLRCLQCGRESQVDTENFVQPGEIAGEPQADQAATALPVLVVEEDLIFRSKLEAAAAASKRRVVLVFAADALARANADGPWARALVALDAQGTDRVALIKALRQASSTLPIVAYGSHVQRELHQQARQAGATQVLPRSELVQRLGEFLAP